MLEMERNFRNSQRRTLPRCSGPIESFTGQDSGANFSAFLDTICWLLVPCMHVLCVRLALLMMVNGLMRKFFFTFFNLTHPQHDRHTDIYKKTQLIWNLPKLLKVPNY